MNKLCVFHLTAETEWTIIVIINFSVVDWEKAGQDVLRGKLKEKRNLNTAKNAILFIGDGMGMSSITGGRIYKGQQKGNTGEEEVLNFDTFPSIGLAKVSNTG